MSKHTTAIEWTHVPGYKGETWNPTIGCSHASPGCLHCYAEAQAGRIVRMGAGKGAGEGVSAQYAKVVRTSKRGLPVWNGELLPLPSRLDVPLRAKAPRCYFVNSMSDLFHENVPDEFIAAVFSVMAACPQHLFIVLTKRAERMREWFEWLSEHRTETGTYPLTRDVLRQHACAYGLANIAPFNLYSRWAKLGLDFPLPNVWLGVSCENQEWADKRIPHLLATPAAVRLVSLEPLLGPIDLNRIQIPDEREGLCFSALVRAHDDRFGSSDTLLNWVIVGGESGPDRRACEPAWIDDVVQQCAEAGVACFVKQDSAHKPGQQGRLSAATWGMKQFPEVVR